jgi:hypothetical protein
MALFKKIVLSYTCSTQLLLNDTTILSGYHDLYYAAHIWMWKLLLLS